SARRPRPRPARRGPAARPAAPRGRRTRSPRRPPGRRSIGSAWRNHYCPRVPKGQRSRPFSNSLNVGEWGVLLGRRGYRRSPPNFGSRGGNPSGRGGDSMEQNLFGQILINFNLITQEQLDKVIELQKKSNPPRLLGELLVEQGFLDDKSLKSILSVQKRKLELTKTGTRAPESELQRRLQGAPVMEFLRVAKELGASDLYITSGLKPMIRLHGNLLDLPADAPGFEDSRKLLLALLTKEQVDEYYAKKYVDFSLELEGIGRFRTSIMRHLKGIAGVFRVIAETVVPFDRLGLPPVVRSFVDYSRGMVLVTGPAGSGKSTTMTALIDIINRHHRLHVITIEDPIEVVHKSDKSFISQREIPKHSHSFASALRAALREDPDVIVVGELRDPETVQTAITAAETGHLIFGTLHTQSAARTV